MDLSKNCKGVKSELKLNTSQSSFIWSTQVRQIAGKQEVLSSDHYGQVKCQSINFNRVHGLYKSQYASRDNLTDILVRHLDDDQIGTIRVKCREIISLVAIHDTVLAVQCRGKMKVFSQNSQGYESVAVFDVPEQVSLLGKICHYLWLFSIHPKNVFKF